MESSAATHTTKRGSRVDGDPTPRDETQIARPAANRAAVLARALLTADLAAAGIGGAVAAIAAGASLGEAAWLIVAAILLWPAIEFVLGLYVADSLAAWTSGVPEAPRLLAAALTLSWPVFGLCALIGVDAAVTTPWLVGSTLLFTAIGRATARSVVHHAGSLRQRTLIIGSGVVAGQVAEKLTTHEQFGLVPVGLLDDDVHDVGTVDLPRLGSFSQLGDVLHELTIDRVIIAFSRAGHDQLLACIRTCRDHGVAVDVVPRLFEFLDGVRSLDHLAGLPVLSIGTPKLSRSAHLAKRLLDVVVGSLCLVVLSPLFLIVALAIRIESRGPVFFRQERAGCRGESFKLVKFRSMYTDAEQRKHEYADRNDALDDVLFKIHDDPRITRVGKLLRKTSMDELPQLINVVKGEMSLVGPRPLILPEARALSEDWHQRRLDLRPGMTGPWQVNGRSQTPFQEMLRFDYQYVAGWSLGRDLVILLATIPAVLSQRGAY
jgi:exopolysaccharide biosynthesis polyprenyl glycosylphosphotransferase